MPLTMAQIVPVQQRERGQTAMDAMQRSIVEVELKLGGLKPIRKCVPFVQFAEVGDPPEGMQPAAIYVPGLGKIGMLLSTTRRDLPAQVKLAAFEAKKYPGAAEHVRGLFFDAGGEGQAYGDGRKRRDASE